MLDFLFWLWSLEDGNFVFLLGFILIFYFASDKMENMWLPSQEIGVTENVFAGVFAAFVEAVHIELSDERVDVSVSEVFG